MTHVKGPQAKSRERRPGAVGIAAGCAARRHILAVYRHHVAVLAAVLGSDLIGRVGNYLAIRIVALPAYRLAAPGFFEGTVFGLQSARPVARRKRYAGAAYDTALKR